MKIGLGLVFIAASSAILAGCNAGSPARPAAPETAQARVVQTAQQQIPAIARVTGTLHAHETATISAQVMGRVQQVLVHQGDPVRAGQTLAILDDASLKSAVDQAQAGVSAAQQMQAAAQTNADLAASTLARYKQLQAQKSVSPQEFDEVSRRAEGASAQMDAARAQVNAAKAQEAGARTMLSYARVKAPFAGVVTARMVDPGALASPGVPLFQIDAAGPLQLQTSIDESLIAAVRIGMPIHVTVDSAGAEPLTGTVAEIVPAADPMSHSFLIKIDVPHAKELRAGMYATAEVPSGTPRQAILAPASAIVQRGSLAVAYAVDSNGIAQLRYVTLGAAHGDQVEVLSGLAAGEKLIDNPADRDFAGKRIEVQL